MTATNDTATKLCSIDGCDKPLLARGWCATHYHRNRTHGAPSKKLNCKVKKDCEWCGATMVLRPSEAKTKKCCSLSCSSNNSARERGLRSRQTQILCLGCGALSVRSVAKTNDAGKYCSRQCAFNHKAKIGQEVAAIRRIARQSLKLNKSITRRSGSCQECGGTYIRRRKYQRHCSAICAQSAVSRSLEISRKHRRTYKLARRAMMRGREADSIDPIKVFERDGWICHICGRKTLKTKRGTAHPKAPELEHIISLSSGGTHTWGNVACSCRQCNNAKGAASFGQLGLDIPA